MKATQRGKQLAAIALSELILGAVLLDQLIVASSLAILLMLALDLSSLIIRERKFLKQFAKESQAKITIEAVAGREKKIPLELPGKPRPVEIHADKAWCRVSEDERAIIVKPPHFGKHSVKIKATIPSLGRCFEKEIETPIELEVTALPKALKFLAIAIGALSEIGEKEEGRKPSKTARGGTDYKGLREYTPGDKPKYIDWPHTAKHLKPIVREYASSEGAVILLVNEDTTGPQTSDFIASAILTVALTALKTSTPVSLATVSRGTLASYGELDPRTLLLYATKKSIELLGINYELLEYVQPLPTEKLSSILKALEASQLLEPVRRRFLEIHSLLGKTPPEATVLYIGTLTSNTYLIADLVHEASKKKIRTIIVASPKPWEDLPSQEEKELARKTHEKMLTFLSRYSKLHFTTQNLERELTPLLLKSRAS